MRLRRLVVSLLRRRGGDSQPDSPTRPMLGAQRRIEARIGQLLGAAVVGSHHSVTTEGAKVGKDDRSDFRILSRALGDCELTEDEWRKSRRALVSLVRNRLADGKRHYGDGLYKRAAEITGLGTQREIGEWLGVSQQAISEDTKNSNLGKIGETLGPNWNDKSVGETARRMDWPLTDAWAAALQGMDDEERLGHLDIKTQPYDVWNFPKLTNTVKIFGSIPQEIIDNLLYYYTKPFDVQHISRLLYITARRRWRESRALVRSVA